MDELTLSANQTAKYEGWDVIVLNSACPPHVVHYTVNPLHAYKSAPVTPYYAQQPENRDVAIIDLINKSIYIPVIQSDQYI